MFGETTNNLRKNIGWAKKGIFSFSNVPLTMLSFAGTVLFLQPRAGRGAGRRAHRRPGQRSARHRHARHPRAAFGSLNLFAIGLLGEYLARVFEEVKRRPLYVR